MSINFYKNLRKLGLLVATIIFYVSTAYSQGLSGVKTVDPLGAGVDNYTTLKEAIDSLNSKGVGNGGVTFNIVAGFTETAPAGGYAVTATGTLANPIIFQKNGVGANPLLTAYTGGTGLPSSANPAPDGIFRLVGSDYVTINGIDLTENPANTTSPATMEYGYALFKASRSNGCQHVTIQNCVVTLSRSNVTSGSGPMQEGSVGILAINAKPDSATTTLSAIVGRDGTNSYNKFYSNTIQNVNYGIALIGATSSSPFLESDTLNDIGGNSALTGNTIINFGGGAASTNPSAAIRTLSQYGINISYNTINNNNGSGVDHVSTLRGIFLGAATSANSTITHNNVILSSGATSSQVSGIESGAGSTASGNTIKIWNNTVSIKYLTSTTATVYGIFASGSAAINDKI